MRVRIGFLAGLIIGYILGAKAGEERYRQIQSLWGTVRRSDPGQQVAAEVHLAADKAGKAVEEKASESVNKVTQLLHGDAPNQA